MRQRNPRQRAPWHLEAIRQLPCVVCQDPTATEAAHISRCDHKLGKRERGIGAKADDKWTVPLCSFHHGKQHKMGEDKFWEWAGIVPELVASTLWILSPDHNAMSVATLRYSMAAHR